MRTSWIDEIRQACHLLGRRLTALICSPTPHDRDIAGESAHSTTCRRLSGVIGRRQARPSVRRPGGGGRAVAGRPGEGDIALHITKQSAWERFFW